MPDLIVTDALVERCAQAADDDRSDATDSAVAPSPTCIPRSAPAHSPWPAPALPPPYTPHPPAARSRARTTDRRIMTMPHKVDQTIFQTDSQRNGNCFAA